MCIIGPLLRSLRPYPMGRQHAEVPSLGVAAFIGFAAQAKPVWFENATASTLHIHILPFGFNPGDATGTRGIGV